MSQSLPAYIASQPTLEDTRTRWIVMDQSTRDDLLARQEEWIAGGGGSFRVQPIELTDGRWALRADTVTEIGPNGVYAPLFARFDPAKVAATLVVDDETIQPLLPEPEEEP